MKKFLMLAVAAGALAVPALAGAVMMHGDGPKGPVTRAELQKKIADKFAAIDTNKDGGITKAEFDAHHEAMKKEWAEKRAKRQDERFAMMDTDKNGQISKAEYDAHNAARAEKREEWHKDRGDGRDGGHRGHHGMMMGGRMGGDHFARMDANTDGKVTLAEMSAKPLTMFDKADANKDGTVTPEERKAAWGKMREEWKEKAAAKPAA